MGPFKALNVEIVEMALRASLNSLRLFFCLPLTSGASGCEHSGTIDWIGREASPYILGKSRWNIAILNRCVKIAACI
jgi:hypothetical protein